MGRMESNEASVKQVLDHPEFQSKIAALYLRKVHGRLRGGAGRSWASPTSK